MAVLDDAYRRNVFLRRLVEAETEKARNNPDNEKFTELGIVEIEDEKPVAQLKVDRFFEGLGRRVDELGFLDGFAKFESELKKLRAASKKTGRRPPVAERLKRYLHEVAPELASHYQLVLKGRHGFAHGDPPSYGLPVPVDQEKDLLERVLETLNELSQSLG